MLLNKHKSQVLDYSDWKQAQIDKSLEQSKSGPIDNSQNRGKKIQKRPVTATNRTKRPYEMTNPQIKIAKDKYEVSNYIQEKSGNIISLSNLYPNY